MNIFGSSDPAQILIVDDNPHSRLLLMDLLKKAEADYNLLEFDGFGSVFAKILEVNPDLILLDIRLPEDNGFDICQQVKADHRTQNIPVILMTVDADNQARLKSQEVKAEVLLSKPLEKMVLLPEVTLLVQRKRLYEWLEQIQQVLFLIAEAIENRYTNGTSSRTRIDQIAQSFGHFLKLSPVEINDLILASHLHDIGMVVIPDSVFLKKNKLTSEERKLIQQHVLIGEKICKPMQNRRGIAQIIRHHHEKWNGSGYPDGLKGEHIPYLAQIFQILDIYDALTSERPYKKALSSQEALTILKEEKEKGWRNPDLVEKFAAFMQNYP